MVEKYDKYHIKKIVMLFIIICIAMSPSYAKTIHPPVTAAFYKDGTAQSGIIAYMDLGFGHSGSWSISGNFWTRNGGSHAYSGSGTVLPVFSRYWGPKRYAPYITSYNLKGTANFN